MEQKKFNIWNRLTALAVFLLSCATYFSTVEPTASFWDCGEFIASSYKLEVGHPPGNPVFQLIARFFTIFTDASHAAVAVNLMSALCSALTILFLYLTLVFLIKRIVRPRPDGSWEMGKAVAVIAGAAVGALVYTFSDTFWFSAVEGEVYAMSSLMTALVVWAMTKWYEQADSPYANRWIVLISFLMGLSIGIHLLNLLAIPALVFLYDYRRRGDKPYSFKDAIKVFAVGVLILALILFLIIPWLPKLAAYFDLVFVNGFGLPYNSGAAFFLLALLGLCFWGLFRTMKKGKVFWNTALLCLTTIVVGFSLFSICIIRSSVKTPTNEYQPDNAFTLVRYLSREQYGSTPLVYGQYYDAPYDVETSTYWAPVDGKYEKVPGQPNPKYHSAGKMLFPRMWSGGDQRYIEFYEQYTGGKGTSVRGASHKKPSFLANLYFFFDFQLNWMYWRYFMWNFVGRQNDIHAPARDRFTGNWESGIGPLDRMRLGDQGEAPAILKDNKGKNHYYFLPLLLGIIGIFFQFGRDKRGSWLTFLLFFMTGIAVVLYLNQPPYQVRERDYAYAGSFYAFCIWVGLGVTALCTWASEKAKDGKARVAAASLVGLACLGVPALMAQQNWDDHDRSNRRTAVELASNYLNSVGEQGILITHGDNDTFPLWYAQEVEGVRTDVRICNTSLLGTDWHIDQMKYACNASKPLPLTIPPRKYLYGTNEWIYILDQGKGVTPLSKLMYYFKNYPETSTDGSKIDVIRGRRYSIPVNKENALRYGIVPEKYADRIPEEIVLEIPSGKNYLTKPELFMLDLLSNYQWDRPIHMLNMGGDLNIGIKDYLMFEGFSYKFVPIKNKTTLLSPGFVDAEGLYAKLKDVYRFDALKRQDYDVDYQNYYTFLGVLNQRAIFLTVAQALENEGDKARTAEVLALCEECFPETTFPLETVPIGLSTNDYVVIAMVDTWFRIGEPERAKALAGRLGDLLVQGARFYAPFYREGEAKTEFETTVQYLYLLQESLEKGGEKALSDKYQQAIDDLTLLLGA